jgi:hypothetical protein
MYKSRLARLAVLLTMLAGFAGAAEPAEVFVSTTRRVLVVELFTSEGCSSCPPAERWLTRFKDTPGLWREVLPLAFHVDYWDRLGGVDGFSDRRFSQRQRQYQRTGHLGSVYTPGIVVNGEEWRKFFNPRTRHDPLPQPTAVPGKLVLTRSGTEVTLAFKGTDRLLVGNVVYLAMGVKSRVAGGENAGKLLTEDFVVLSHAARKGARTWKFHNLDVPSGASAIAAWVSAPGDPTPIQAVAGTFSAGR